MDSAFLANSRVLSAAPKTASVICGGNFRARGMYIRNDKSKQYYTIFDEYELYMNNLELDTVYLKYVSHTTQPDLIIQYNVLGGGTGVSERVTWIAVVDYTEMKMIFNKAVAEEDEFHGPDDTDGRNGTYNLYGFKPVYNVGEIDLNDAACNGCEVRPTQIYLQKGDCFIRKR